jgi:hypothetical protein
LNTGGEKTPHRPKVGVVLQLQQRVGSATARTSSRKSPRCEFDSEVKIDFVYQAQILQEHIPCQLFLIAQAYLTAKKSPTAR